MTFTQGKQEFIDPKTNQSFEAQAVVDDKHGHIGWLVPLWVKSEPEQWTKLYRKEAKKWKN